MRMGIVVAGIVLLIIGAVLLFVPIVQQPDQTVDTSGSSFPFGAVQIAGFSLTGSIPVSVTWSSPSAVTVFAATCSSGCASASSASSIGGIAIQTGTGGTFTLSQPNGGYLVYGALNTSGGGGAGPTVTFKITTALSTIGSVVLVLGILLLIVGLVLKSKSAKTKAMPPAPAPADMSASGGTDAPSSGGMPPSS